MQAHIDLAFIDQVTAGRLGQHDIACPICGPMRRSPVNQRRKVLRIWRVDPGFAGFHCARCGERGHTRNPSAPRPDPAALERARTEAAERERLAVGERLGKARWLWSKRQPLAGSIAETYLRLRLQARLQARGYGGPLPTTLGFLPARGKHGPAMIAAFGLPDELEPGLLAIADEAVRGIHITRIAPDGSGKANTGADKIMLGASLGSPIVLAPVNDLLGLSIAEGIENALSVHATTGLGAWAAGSASRLTWLADVVPAYVECVTIMVDDDRDGRRYADALAKRLSLRGIEVCLTAAIRRAGGSRERTGLRSSVAA
jgi:hypothetical protein